MNYQDGDALLILRDGGGVVNHSFTPNSQIQYNSEGDATKLKSYTLR